ncbi:MAG: RHS repeat-associated core domain-containing protein, partial [Cyclobacteriaceae bacterium]
LPIVERSYEKQDYRYDYHSLSRFYIGRQYSEKDDETGYNAFHLRQYDARIGRWISPDPYGQYASAYVGMGNNPVSGVDPDGGWSWTTAAIGAGVGGITGYAASGGDWKYALGGAVAGGALGGAMFKGEMGWRGSGNYWSKNVDNARIKFYNDVRFSWSRNLVVNKTVSVVTGVVRAGNINYKGRKFSKYILDLPELNRAKYKIKDINTNISGFVYEEGLLGTNPLESADLPSGEQVYDINRSSSGFSFVPHKHLALIHDKLEGKEGRIRESSTTYDQFGPNYHESIFQPFNSLQYGITNVRLNVNVRVKITNRGGIFSKRQFKIGNLKGEGNIKKYIKNQF